MNKNQIKKYKQRKNALLKRKKIYRQNKKVSENLYNHLCMSNFYKNSKFIGSYYSIKDEMQTRDLNKKIIKSGKVLCLPVMKSVKMSLMFKVVNKKTKLIKNKFNIMEPDKKLISVNPDIILVPCVAFDSLGNRLGYGGGYYDRTINKLKTRSTKSKSIIVAFSQQKIKKVIHNKKDQKCSYILTEKELISVSKK